MSNITNKAQMLNDPHWAIVTYDSVHHAADQRSIDCPGHGYPAYSEEVVKYQSFINEADWKEQIREYTARRESFSAMRVIPAKISTEIKVDVDYE